MKLIYFDAGNPQKKKELEQAQSVINDVYQNGL